MGPPPATVTPLPSGDEATAAAQAAAAPTAAAVTGPTTTTATTATAAQPKNSAPAPTPQLNAFMAQVRRANAAQAAPSRPLSSGTAAPNGTSSSGTAAPVAPQSAPQTVESSSASSVTTTASLPASANAPIVSATPAARTSPIPSSSNAVVPAAGSGVSVLLADGVYYPVTPAQHRSLVSLAPNVQKIIYANADVLRQFLTRLDKSIAATATPVEMPTTLPQAMSPPAGYYAALRAQWMEVMERQARDVARREMGSHIEGNDYIAKFHQTLAARLLNSIMEKTVEDGGACSLAYSAGRHEGDAHIAQVRGAAIEQIRKLGQELQDARDAGRDFAKQLVSVKTGAEQVRQRLIDAEKTVNALKTQLAAGNSETAALKKQLAAAQSETGELRTQLGVAQAATADKAKINAELEKLRKRVEGIDAEIADANARATERIRKNNEKLAAEYRKSEEVKADADRRVAEAKAIGDKRLADVEKKLAAAHAATATALKDHDATRNQVAELKEALESAQAEWTLGKEERDAESEAIAVAQRLAADAAKDRDEAIKKRDEAVNQLATLKSAGDATVAKANSERDAAIETRDAAIKDRDAAQADDTVVRTFRRMTSEANAARDEAVAAANAAKAREAKHAEAMAVVVKERDSALADLKKVHDGVASRHAQAERDAAREILAAKKLTAEAVAAEQRKNAKAVAALEAERDAALKERDEARQERDAAKRKAARKATATTAAATPTANADAARPVVRKRKITATPTATNASPASKRLARRQRTETETPTPMPAAGQPRAVAPVAPVTPVAPITPVAPVAPANVDSPVEVKEEPAMPQPEPSLAWTMDMREWTRRSMVKMMKYTDGKPWCVFCNALGITDEDLPLPAAGDEEGWLDHMVRYHDRRLVSAREKTDQRNREKRSRRSSVMKT